MLCHGKAAIGDELPKCKLRPKIVEKLEKVHYPQYSEQETAAETTESPPAEEEFARHLREAFSREEAEGDDEKSNDKKASS